MSHRWWRAEPRFTPGAPPSFHALTTRLHCLPYGDVAGCRVGEQETKNSSADVLRRQYQVPTGEKSGASSLEMVFEAGQEMV